MLFFEARYEDSIEQLKRTLEIDAQFHPSLIYLGWNYIKKEMYQEAINVTQKALSLYEGSIPAIANKITIYALSGQTEKAQKIFDDLIAEASKIYVGPFLRAATYSLLGENDKAFEWLERAYDEKGLMPNFIKYGLWSDNFRSDPRFAALLKKMGLQ
jgi:tetratricopeptide (TPR) repeat protein